MRATFLAAGLIALVVAEAVRADEVQGLSPAGLPLQVPVTTTSTDARAAFARGRSLYYNLRTADARRSFEEAVKKDPAFASAWVHLALTTRPVTAGKDAIDRAVKLRTRLPEGERLFVEAVAAQVNGRIDEEEKARDALAKAYPNDWRVLVARGNRLIRWGRANEAIPHLEKATQVAPDEAAPWNDLGYAYARSARLDDAVRALKQYVARLPSEPNPHDSLAEILLEAGRPRDAIEEYAKALQLDPAFVIAYEGLGHARLLSGDFEGAREAYRRLADAGETPWERMSGLDWLAATWPHEGRLDEAVRALERAEKAARLEKAAAWTALFPARRALVLVELGRTKEALNAASAAIDAANKARLAPGLQGEVAAYTRLVKALVLQRESAAGGKQAADLLKTVKDSGDPRLAALAGLLRGEEVFDAALSGDPWGLALAADAFESRGDTKRATELRTQATRLNRVTPELGLVRPRLLAGASRAGTRFGPMPITTSSSAALALFNEGRRLGEAYERGVAVATLEKAIELDPDFALARCFLAIFSESPEEGDAQARAAAKLAQAGKTSDGERLFIEAHLAAFDGDDAKKAAKLTELAKLYADDWRPVAYLGEHHLRHNEHGKAIEQLREAVRRSPEEAYPNNGLGYALAYEGRYVEAVEALRRYVRLSPGESNPHDSLAEVLMLAGRFAEAEEEYRRSLELSPSFVSSLAGLGHARLFKGDVGGAREAYARMGDRAALRMDRVLAQTWSAHALAWDGRFLDAAAALARAELEAEESRDRLGEALLSARRITYMAEGGRSADAIALADHLVTRVRALTPSARGMVERLVVFGRGWAQLVAGDVKAAAKSATDLRALAKKAPHPEALTLTAVLEAGVAAARNDHGAALVALEKADRRHPLVQVLLAEALEQTRQATLAKPLRQELEQPTSNHLDLAVARRRHSQLAR